MEFPRLVYKDGGPHQRPGGTFDYVCVDDEEQLQARLAEGWAMTVDEALAPPVPPAPSPAPSPAPVSAPPPAAAVAETIESLQAEFDAQGIAYDKRWGLKRLQALKAEHQG